MVFPHSIYNICRFPAKKTILQSTDTKIHGALQCLKCPWLLTQFNPWEKWPLKGRAWCWIRPCGDRGTMKPSQGWLGWHIKMQTTWQFFDRFWYVLINRHEFPEMCWFPEMGAYSPFIFLILVGLSRINQPFWRSPIYGSPRVPTASLNHGRTSRMFTREPRRHAKDPILDHTDLGFVCTPPRRNRTHESNEGLLKSFSIWSSPNHQQHSWLFWRTRTHANSGLGRRCFYCGDSCLRAYRIQAKLILCTLSMLLPTASCGEFSVSQINHNHSKPT